jgi:SAM-dependent methyltransferase
MARDWEQTYRDEPVDEMPWFYRDLDPDVARALSRHGVKSGRALDLGTGPATQAIALAKLGFDVVGTDIAASAIEHAETLVRRSGVALQLIQDDILATQLSDTFDLILDRGCFHVMTDEQRPHYLANVARLAAQGSLLFLKCFSFEEPGTNGPRRYHPDQITALFSRDFEVVSVEPTVYQGTLDPWPKALFSVMRRR